MLGIAAVSAGVAWYVVAQERQREEEARRQHMESATLAAKRFVQGLNRGDVQSILAMAGPSFFSDLVRSCNALRNCGAPWDGPTENALQERNASTNALCLLTGGSKQHPDCGADKVEREVTQVFKNARARVGECAVSSVYPTQLLQMGSSTDLNFVDVDVRCDSLRDTFQMNFDPGRQAWRLDGTGKTWLLRIWDRARWPN